MEQPQNQNNKQDIFELFGNFLLKLANNCTAILTKMVLSMRKLREIPKRDSGAEFMEKSRQVPSEVRQTKKYEDLFPSPKDNQLKSMVRAINGFYSASTHIFVLDITVEKDITRPEYLARVRFVDLITNKRDLTATFNFRDSEHLARVMSDFPSQARKELDKA